MSAVTVEVGVGQPQRRQLAEVFLAQRRELVEQAGQRSALRHRDLREAIELVEGPRLAALQDDSGAGDPVGSLAMDQVSDDIEGAPCLATFVGHDPAVRKAAEQRVERRRRPRQDGDPFIHHERTSRAIGLSCHVDCPRASCGRVGRHFSQERVLPMMPTWNAKAATSAFNRGSKTGVSGRTAGCADPGRR